MPQKKGFKRYWRMVDGAIERTTSYVDLPDWEKGIGPIDPQLYEERKERLGRIHRGKPKSESQREKMRDAKVGVGKSQEHRAAMSAAHILRSMTLKQIQEEHDCSWKEAIQILKERK